MSTTTAFLDALRASGLFEPDQLNDHLGRLGPGLPDDPRQLADLLVRAGALTRFQADRLLAGKTRGFLIRGKYKLLDVLGVGGMGRVFLCEHVHLRRLVALKMLSAEQLKERASVERFYREARAVAALDHPNIVRVYDVEPDEKMPLMVMEFVDGVNLQTLVTTRGPLEVGRAANVVGQAAMGLQHAGEAGLVHRDVKPGNLLLDKNGTVKVLDLGLARFFTDKSDKLTRQHDPNAVLGTAEYLAPEQALSVSEADTRADVYALGGTLFFLLTGRTPFEGEAETLHQKLMAHQFKDVPPLRAFRPDAPPEIDAVIRRMMAKRPEDRFQQPVEVAQALGPWAHLPMSPLALETAQPGSGRLPTVVRSQAATAVEAGGAGYLTPTGLTPPSGPVPSPRRYRPAAVAGGVALVLTVAVAAAILVANAQRPAEITQATDPNAPPRPEKELPPVPGVIPATEARKNVWRKATVRFEVVTAGIDPYTDGLPVVLASMITADHPSAFTVAVPSAVFRKSKTVSPENMVGYFKGATVEVTGQIVWEAGAARIVVSDMDQIKIVN